MGRVAECNICKMLGREFVTPWGQNNGDKVLMGDHVAQHLQVGLDVSGPRITRREADKEPA